jgi:hypothetical protein
MPNTFTLRRATPFRLVYELTGDGTVQGPTLGNATLQAAAPAGPLKQALNTVFADQAAARQGMLMGVPIRVTTQTIVTPVDTTGQANQLVADVDLDAGAGNKGEVNVSMSDTTGQIGILTIEYVRGENR